MSKKFLLLGTWTGNTGPSNVNKGFVLHRDFQMSYIHSSGRLYRLERLKLLFYPTIVVSGGILNYELALCKLLRKKIIYIMHGCGKYESGINNLNLPQSFFDLEDKTLRASDRIVCVSKKYSKWVKERYPQYKNKITYVNNGLNINIRVSKFKEPFSIAISGGNRLQKKNGIVCKAVQKLINQGYQCNVYLFGREYPNNEDLSSFHFIKKMGHLNQEQYYSVLDRIQLFVINSIVESFGLVVADALNCNCSLLMSNGVGATSVMDTRDEDVIMDCEDVNEVTEKMKFLLHNPNAKRLYDSIDKESTSERTAYLNLTRIINEA